MESAENRYVVFLSYNSDDRPAVKQIADYLRRVGLRPFFDEYELIPGESSVSKLYSAMKQADSCAVFVGKSGKGPWQALEVRRAIEQQVTRQGFRVIPVLLPDAVEQPELPDFLSGYTWVDFRGKTLNDDDALWRLECGINGVAPMDGRPKQDNDPPPDPLWREHYLRWLMEQVSVVSLAGIDKKAASRDADACLNLGAIYTALLTQQAERDMLQERGERRLSAVAQANAHRHLVLLGDPGSGKSTFVNFVVLCLAGELLQLSPPSVRPEPVEGQLSLSVHGEPVEPERTDALRQAQGERQLMDCLPNLALLTAPLPDKNGDDEVEEDKSNKEKKKKYQPWQHGALLPLRVILRDFAARGLPEAGADATVVHLWEFVTQEFDSIGLSGVVPPLKAYLQTQGGLLLFDGLDEVPEAESRRTQIKQVVEAAAKAFPNCRIIVTSRTYAYQQQEWRLTNFAETVLSSFSQGQIRRFVDHWYAHIGRLRNLHPDDAQGRAEALKRAILSNDRIYSLAERPLLLTLMASLHAWRGGSLPERREDLYNDAVELLLDWWEQPKIVKDRAGKILIQHPSLTELLKVGSERVRRVISQLAFAAHAAQTDDRRTADIAEDDLVNALLRVSPDKDLRPKRLLEHLSDRAGLLVPRGVKVYTFPHRTFQEYLAACHIADCDDYPDNIAELAAAAAAPNRWREAALLSAAKAMRGSAKILWDFVDAFCEQENAYAALFAAQAVAENADFDHLSDRNRKKIERLKAWLTAILTEYTAEPCQGCEPLPAIERALAGNLLAGFGDDRKGVGVISMTHPLPLPGGETSDNSPPGRGEGWVLPDIEWITIPAGAFWMGSDEYNSEKPRHRVTFREGFEISRYPITNAQYQAFVEEGGKEPETYRDPFGFSNHPVVGVSWYDAVAFCEWLTRRLRDAGALEQEMVVRLPTEAEWEYAARGKPTPGPSEEGRYERYPWGGEITPEHANYGDTKIGATSAVGCFPRGRSAFGCEEMIGNVLEWCLDSYVDTYNNVPENGEMVGNLGDKKAKVRRGGAWHFNSIYCRSSHRYWFDPDLQDDDLGFRVVVAAR